MKIAILQTIHPPLDKRMYYKVARSLASAGHEVVSIGPPGDAPLPEQAGIRFEPLPKSHGLVGRALSLVHLIRKGIRARADVYVCPELDSWLACWVVTWFTGAKMVFDVHEYTPNHIAKLFPVPFRPPLRWLTIGLLRFLARRSAHLILTRASLGNDYDGLSVPKTVVLNTNHLQPPCAEIPESLAARYGRRPMLIHQGIFGDVRGSYQLLEAMRRVTGEMPDAACIVLGRYVYGSEGAYREAIAAAGMDAHMDLIAEVPFAEVPAYIAVARAGLILFQPIGLGHTLGLPHKLFDYMREGVPVIAPDFCVEIRRIVEEADCGILVDATVPASIADAILRLLREPELAARLGANGRRAVETTYNWQNEERKLLAVFAGLERTS